MEGPQLLLKLIHNVRKVKHENTCEGLARFQGFWSGGAKIGKNPLF
jgi:hypothetical protein